MVSDCAVAGPLSSTVTIYVEVTVGHTVQGPGLLFHPGFQT